MNVPRLAISGSQLLPSIWSQQLLMGFQSNIVQLFIQPLHCISLCNCALYTSSALSFTVFIPTRRVSRHATQTSSQLIDGHCALLKFCFYCRRTEHRTKRTVLLRLYNILNNSGTWDTRMFCLHDGIHFYHIHRDYKQLIQYEDNLNILCFYGTRVKSGSYILGSFLAGSLSPCSFHLFSSPQKDPHKLFARKIPHLQEEGKITTVHPKNER